MAVLLLTCAPLLPLVCCARRVTWEEGSLTSLCPWCSTELSHLAPLLSRWVHCAAMCLTCQKSWQSAPTCVSRHCAYLVWRQQHSAGAGTIMLANFSSLTANSGSPPQLTDSFSPLCCAVRPLFSPSCRPGVGPSLSPPPSRSSSLSAPWPSAKTCQTETTQLSASPAA